MPGDRLTRQNEKAREEQETHSDLATELASIKAMLTGKASDIVGMKTSLESLRNTVQQLGGGNTEAETCISMLEDGCNLERKQ